MSEPEKPDKYTEDQAEFLDSIRDYPADMRNARRLLEESWPDLTKAEAYAILAYWQHTRREPTKETEA